MSIFDVHHQPTAHAVVQQSLLSGRLAHGLLLAGPSGVGKEMFATRLAQLLLCEKPVKVSDGPKRAGLDVATAPAGLAPVKGSSWLDACGKCESCHLVEVDSHPDLHRVYRELHKLIRELKDRKGLELYIDVIREFLINPSASKAARGHGKVFIVRDAHLMNDEAQNALLKTLEEPPAGTFIMLLTDQAHGLLETIRSRSQLVRFAPLPIDFVRGQLAGRSMGPRKIGAEEAGYLAGRSGGQMGVALQMAEGDLFGLHQELSGRLASLTAADGIDLADWLEEQINTLARERVEREDITDSQAKKEVACDLLSTMALVLADAIRHGAGYESGTRPSLLPTASTKLARDGGEDRLGRLGKAIDAIRRADYLIAVRFVNLRLALDEVSLALASLLAE